MSLKNSCQRWIIDADILLGALLEARSLQPNPDKGGKVSAADGVRGRAWIGIALLLLLLKQSVLLDLRPVPPMQIKGKKNRMVKMF